MIQPLMTIVGLQDESGPLRILVECGNCGQTVSDQVYGESDLVACEKDLELAEMFVQTCAESDGDKLIDHVREQHGLDKCAILPPIVKYR